MRKKILIPVIAAVIAAAAAMLIIRARSPIIISERSLVKCPGICPDTMATS